MASVQDIGVALNKLKKWNLKTDGNTITFKFKKCTFSVEKDLYRDNIIIIFSIINPLPDAATLITNVIHKLAIENMSDDSIFGYASISSAKNMIVQTFIDENDFSIDSNLETILSKFFERVDRYLSTIS